MGISKAAESPIRKMQWKSGVSKLRMAGNILPSTVGDALICRSQSINSGKIIYGHLDNIESSDNRLG
jgi:hypothetical protein